MAKVKLAENIQETTQAPPNYIGHARDSVVPGKVQTGASGWSVETDWFPEGEPFDHYAQSQWLYNFKSFFYPLGFLTGAARGVIEYMQERSALHSEFSMQLNNVVSYCAKQIGAKDEKETEAPAGDEQGEEERGNVPGQRGDAYSPQLIEARLRFLEEESDNSRMGEASRIIYN